MALTLVTTAMWLLLLFVVLVLLTVVMVWQAWVRLEARKQHERMRQGVNGGGADMPPWLTLAERERERERHRRYR